MDTLLDFLSRGGPFIYLLLVLWMLSGPVVLGLSVAVAYRRRVPLAVWLLLPAAFLLTGFVGTVQGLSLTAEAVGHASHEMAATLASAGLGVSLVTTEAAAYAAALTLVVSAAATAVASAIWAGRGGHWTPLHMVPVAVGLAVGGTLAVLDGAAQASLLMVCGLPMLLACARAGGSERAEIAAHARWLTVALAGTAGLCLAMGRWVHGQSTAFDVVAFASAETRQSMLLAAEVFSVGPVLGACALFLGGAVGVAPLRAWFSSRAAGLGAVATAVVVVGAGLAGVGTLSFAMSNVLPLTVPWQSTELAELQDLDIALPQSTSQRAPHPAVTLRVSEGRRQLDGVTIGGGPRDGMDDELFRALDEMAVAAIDLGRLAGAGSFEGRALLQADAGLSVVALEPAWAALAGARFPTLQLGVVSGEGRLGAILVELDWPVHPEAGQSAPPPRASSDLGLPPEQSAEPRLPVGEPDEPALALVVEAVGEGARLHMAAAAAEGVFGTQQVEARDLHELAQLLDVIKVQYPDSEDVTVIAASNLRYGQLIALLDVVVAGLSDEVRFPYITLAPALRDPSSRAPRP
jgi:hypothetical protein